MKKKPADVPRTGRPRPGLRVPDSARVPRPAPADPPWEKAPTIAAGAEVRGDARLRDVAERIRKGDYSDLQALTHPGFGTTTRGQQVGLCNHYLPANRFDWWDAQVPNTDEIRIRPGAETPQEALRDEFCSPFSTVVGADLGELPPAPYGRTISWDDLPDDASPNAVPGIEFSVRKARPESVPVLRTLSVEVGRGRVDRKILINGVEAGYEPDPTRPRPSLFIDFAVPQRAVGLEFGFFVDDESADERVIDPGRVRLIAHDRDGVVLLESSAGVTRTGNLEANTVFNVIGVRHQGGAIRSVELRFGGPDNPIQEPQIVSRIWHEPLPPAAVLQGTLALEGEPVRRAGPGGREVEPGARPDEPGFSPDEDESEPGAGAGGRRGPAYRLPPPVDQQGQPIPFGPAQITLPFLCDRALAMMRGFKLQFLDQLPHEVHEIAAGLNNWSVFRVEPGGTITLDPSGWLLSDTRDAFGYGVPYRVLIYYTLLAWNADQMELYTSEVFDAQSNLTQDDLASGSIEKRDPCPVPDAERMGADPTAVCGPLFGGMQWFRFRTPRDQEYGQIFLATGQIGGAVARST